MPRYLRRVNPWDHGSPFSDFFHELFNEGFEEIHEFVQLKPEIQRLLATPVEPPETASVEDHFPVLIGSTDSIGWAKEYNWVEARLIGSGQGSFYEELPDGRNSTDEDEDGELLFGLALNRVELIDGFGSTVGPYGQPLVDGNSTLTVLEIPPGTPTGTMIFERNDSDIIVPVFEAYNPMTVECAA